MGESQGGREDGKDLNEGEGRGERWRESEKDKVKNDGKRE